MGRITIPSEDAGLPIGRRSAHARDRGEDDVTSTTTRLLPARVLSRRRVVTWLAAPFAAGMLGACATSLNTDPGATAAIPPAEAEKAARRPVKIAMLLPLAGFDQTAAIAKSMKQAGEMALFERDNPHVQLIVKDDKGTFEGARAAAEEALNDGAEVILGPLFAKAVEGAAAVARARNVPVIAFSNDTSVAGNGVYLMSFLAAPEVERIVAFTAGQGKRRFAALISDDAYGRMVEPVFRAAVARAGGTLVHSEIYPRQANALHAPAKRLIEAIKREEAEGQPVDALFLPAGQDVLPQIGPLLALNGIDPARVKLIGTGAWEYPNIGRDATFVGGWYPGPDPQGWREFSERFARTFGSAPPRVASLAFDAVALSIALSANPPGQRYTAANLTRPEGFPGVDGTVAFLADGTSERAMAVLEVQTFGSNIADPAPASLASARLSQAQPSRVAPAGN